MKRHALLPAMLLAFANIVGIGAAGAQAYYGELRLVAFNWCPNGWLPAAGQTLLQNQYAPLYSLIGQTFGSGTYPNSFKLPDMRGLVPAGAIPFGGNQPPPPFAQKWGTTYGIPANPVSVAGTLTGEVTGTINGAVQSDSGFTSTGTGSATLTAQNLPAHTHPLSASSAAGTANSPSGALSPTFTAANKLYAISTAPADTPMSAGAVGPNTGTAPTPVPITVSVPMNPFKARISIPYTASPNYFSFNLSITPQTQAPSLAATWCICAENGSCLYPQRQ